MTDRFLRSNRYKRPYDNLIPMGRKDKVIARRRDPDGDPLKVTQTVRAGHRCNKYPWSKMKNGDFFIVPLTEGGEKSMRIIFAQASARLDIELSVCRWKLPDGTHALRVTKVLEGVKSLRRAAIERGLMKGTVSDGRWRDRKNKWEQDKNARERGGVPVLPKPVTPAKQKRQARKEDNPFWADDEDTSLAPALAPEPDVKLSREEAIRRALEQS